MSFPLALENIQSVCILRLSAIGDVTHVLPVVASLQKAAPHIRITWIIGTIEYKLLKGMKGVDFVVFNKREGLSAYSKLKKTLRTQNFDVLLQMQLSLRANIAAQMIRSRYRVGFDKKRSKELHSFRLTHRIPYVHKQHVLDSFLEFIKVLGVTQTVMQWPIVFSQEDEKISLGWLNKDKINVVISPCSSHPLRNWSAERYAQICDYLVSTYQAQVVLVGGPSEFEKEMSAKIKSLCDKEVTDITGQDTLKQLYVTMKNAQLVISPDSGPAHIANAAGAPVIVLHGATTAQRSGAYKNKALAIDVFEKAAREIAYKDPDQIRWGSQITLLGVMDLITVNAVKIKIDQVLAE